MAALLRVAVIGMGVLIVAGLAVVVVTVLNRVNSNPGEVGRAAWTLPAGAEIADWRLGQGRVAVELRHEGATLIWTFDAETGRRLAEIRLERR